ncbi:hypothetical protein BU24DRAFT_466536 [Aaosphaeria arxii CBS 175.79]|uniref:Uncharacterized protein n=1 Tax=Aaosphaeria arxii CBS 175.79 TaxID=1450172 RepID=A0A6A5XD72_9PLEO|nr:uncharacterized protein BU24DRAFT_466536 [Aaosphaeria arxii CBS 175.79]KAF2010756.1 hypothetical protein BU24DRAFT_466536 [Aaosphaeria arxii CBS 175.79]
MMDEPPHLMTLPYVLREEILKEVICSDNPFRLFAKHIGTCKDLGKVVLPHDDHPPLSIFLVCKQLNEEATWILYRFRALQIAPPLRAGTRIPSMVRVFGSDKLKLLRKIEITIRPNPNVPNDICKCSVIRGARPIYNFAYGMTEAIAYIAQHAKNLKYLKVDMLDTDFMMRHAIVLFFTVIASLTTIKGLNRLDVGQAFPGIWVFYLSKKLGAPAMLRKDNSDGVGVFKAAMESYREQVIEFESYVGSDSKEEFDWRETVYHYDTADILESPGPLNSNASIFGANTTEEIARQVDRGLNIYLDTIELAESWKITRQQSHDEQYLENIRMQRDYLLHFWNELKAMGGLKFDPYSI